MATPEEGGRCRRLRRTVTNFRTCCPRRISLFPQLHFDRCCSPCGAAVLHCCTLDLVDLLCVSRKRVWQTHDKLEQSQLCVIWHSQVRIHTKLLSLLIFTFESLDIYVHALSSLSLKMSSPNYSIYCVPKRTNNGSEEIFYFES